VECKVVPARSTIKTWNSVLAESIHETFEF
jgi:hypothetical protein